MKPPTIDEARAAAQRLCDTARQKSFEVPPLHTLFLSTMVQGESAVISDRDYLSALAFPAGQRRCTAQELWTHLLEHLGVPRHPSLELLLRQGTLASRILKAIGTQASRGAQEEVYRALLRSAEEGRPFTSGG